MSSGGVEVEGVERAEGIGRVKFEGAYGEEEEWRCDCWEGGVRRQCRMKSRARLALFVAAMFGMPRCCSTVSGSEVELEMKNKRSTWMKFFRALAAASTSVCLTRSRAAIIPDTTSIQVILNCLIDT